MAIFISYFDITRGYHWWILSWTAHPIWHHRTNRGIVLTVAVNATLLTLSEWARSRLSLMAGLHLQSRWKWVSNARGYG